MNLPRGQLAELEHLIKNIPVSQFREAECLGLSLRKFAEQLGKGGLTCLRDFEHGHFANELQAFVALIDRELNERQKPTDTRAELDEIQEAIVSQAI